MLPAGPDPPPPPVLLGVPTLPPLGGVAALPPAAEPLEADPVPEPVLDDDPDMEPEVLVPELMLLPEPVVPVIPESVVPVVGEPMTLVELLLGVLELMSVGAGVTVGASAGVSGTVSVLRLQAASPPTPTSKTEIARDRH